jgi:hypothetical protein
MVLMPIFTILKGKEKVAAASINIITETNTQFYSTSNFFPRKNKKLINNHMLDDIKTPPY